MMIRAKRLRSRSHSAEMSASEAMTQQHISVAHTITSARGVLQSMQFPKLRAPIRTTIGQRSPDMRYMHLLGATLLRHTQPLDGWLRPAVLEVDAFNA